MTRPAEQPRHIDPAHLVNVGGDPGSHWWSCSCGEYGTNLPSKRRARAAVSDHLQQESDVLVDLTTPEGRGQAAALAAKRARTAVLNRHALELAELEQTERTRIGLPPTIPGARP